MEVSKELVEVFNRVPANRYFGFQLLSSTAEGAVVSMKVLADYIQKNGVVHGGVISTLADTAAAYSFRPQLTKSQTMTSIEFKMNFLEPALPEDGTLVASSRVIRRGGRIGVCEVDVMQSDKMVARGLFTYMFLNR